MAVSIAAIWRESLTTNEFLFIPAGITYLQRHDDRMDFEEPPLMKLLAAAPALLFHPKIDYNDPAWTEDPGGFKSEYDFSRKFFESWNRDHRALLFASRLPMIAVNLLLGLGLYVMARRIAGIGGAVVTFGLFATSPFYLGYGSIVHMDIPIALFALLTMWFFASLWKTPTRRNFFLFAFSLAGALVTKFSAVFLFPSIVFAWTWLKYREWRSSAIAEEPSVAPAKFRREKLILGSMILACGLAYCFYSAAFYKSDVSTILLNETGDMRLDGLPTLPVDILARRMLTHPVLRPLMLAPSLYAGGLAYVAGYSSRPMYFLGRAYPHGVWFYFPVISFYKLAPGMIAAFFLLAALAAVKGLRDEAGEASASEDASPYLIAVTTCLIVFAVIAMASTLNVGVRHFSVPITLGVLLCSLVVPWSRNVLSGRAQSVAVGLVAISVLSSVLTVARTFPDYLSYYNAFRLGTPKQEIADHSNLFWGQSMEELAEFFHERGIADPYIDPSVGTVEPTIYIPGAREWRCYDPEPATPAWVAVSAIDLSHKSPNCLDLERYPSWRVGGGEIWVFHLVGTSTAADSESQ